MNTTPTTPPRFSRTGPRGREHELASPLPPILGELGASDLAERITQHATLAGRVSELRATVVELTAGVERAKAEQVRKAEQAALAGKPIPRAQATASAEKKLEDKQDELRGLEAALPRSADNLLAFAAPHFGEAAARAREQEAATLARATDLLAATQAALAEAELHVEERVWLEQASASARVQPFRQRSASELTRLAAELDRTFGEAIERRAARVAELQRARSQEQAEAPRRAAAEEQAKREDAAAAVRFEGPRRTHIGGRPVTPQGAFVDEPEAEEEPGSQLEQANDTKEARP
jgi:hypothetical protein